jgi:hypothetical protein
MRKPRAGDWVEIRSKQEILRTLDKNGRLDGLPFMPQMFQYCGRRFRVFKRAHKTCDTVNDTGGRWLSDGIHLDLRCDGNAYGGCQAACLIFWKQAWLRLVDEEPKSMASYSRDEARPGSILINGSSCTEEDVWNGTHALDQPAEDKTRYICQATQLPYFTRYLPWWDARQYVEDYTSGNASLSRMSRGLVYLAYYHGTQAWRNKIGRPARWLYDRFQSLCGGIQYPRRRGTIPLGELAPTCTLNLQPGEFVRVKTHKEILETVDTEYMNRGLAFDAELVPNCGRVYRVQARVHNFIDEKTGKMKTLKTPAVILEGVCCQSRYSNRRMFCPRSIYSWWREIWLERIENDVRR